SEAITGDGAAIFGHACWMDLERIVSKRIASRYVSGRTRAWLKTKNPVSALNSGLKSRVHGNADLCRTPATSFCRNQTHFLSRLFWLAVAVRHICTSVKSGVAAPYIRVCL